MSEQAIVEREGGGRAVGKPAHRGPAVLAKKTYRRALLDRVARRTLGAEYLERIEMLKRETNEFGVDPFGVDPEFIGSAAMAFCWIHRYYFRASVRGIENIPDGRVLIIANHSGQMPFDGAMIATSMLLEGDPPRVPRTMVERWSPTIPYVSILFSRSGQVVGMPENARRLLEHEHPILVFPEGAPGSTKLFNKAYQLQEFGLGFMRLALETGTPIVPVSVVGAEEQYPAFYNFERLARLIGAPAAPVTPFAFIPILGMLPLPTKYHITFGEPLEFTGDPDDDDEVIGEKVWLVRSKIQSMVNHGLREREHIFW